MYLNFVVRYDVRQAMEVENEQLRLEKVLYNVPVRH